MRQISYGIFVAVLLAGCATSTTLGTSSSPPSPDVAIPALTVGDYWLEATSFTTGDFAGHTLVENTTVEALVDANGTQEAAYRLRTTSYWTDGPKDTYRLVRRSDWAVLRDTSDDSDIAFSSCPTIHWPLRVGHSAHWDCIVSGHTGAGPVSFTATEDSTVIGIENVTVHAGTFLAFRVHVAGVTQGQNQDYTYWYRASLCGKVRQDGNGQSTTLRAYRCAAGAQSGLDPASA